jgi:hypothetical protein
MKQIYKYHHSVWKLQGWGCLSCSRSFWTQETAQEHYQQCRIDREAVTIYQQLEVRYPELPASEVKELTRKKINTIYGREVPVTIKVPRPFTEGGAQRGPKPGVMGQATCPHCNKQGGITGIHRWHFDRCKYKPKE